MASGLLGSGVLEAAMEDTGAVEAATEDTGAVEAREEAGVFAACETATEDDAAEEDAKLLSLWEDKEELLEKLLSWLSLL